MPSRKILVLVFALGVLMLGTYLLAYGAPVEPVASTGTLQSDKPASADFVGTKTCAECHKAIADRWAKSGHAWKLNPVVDGKPPTPPFTTIDKLPEGYTWNDISYVIGGYNWKYRFVNKQGYIITDKPGATVSDTKYLNQWNFANPILGKEAGWVTYSSGVANLKYTCGPCHTTGYKPTGNQDNMPGIVGTWNEPGVTCERCHGAGGDHAKAPYNVEMKIDRDPELCGACHRRDSVEAVNAANGFIEHHEQYEELFQSKHITLNCVTCHDPHVGVIQLRQAKQQTTRTQCANCHFKEARNQSDVHKAIKVECIDCHMPRIVKSAWGDAAKFTGDIRAHLMAIDPDQVGQFSPDGKTALSQVSLDFACRNCHVQGGKASVKTDDELKARAKGYHVAK